jgi:hypothetical protein
MNERRSSNRLPVSFLVQHQTSPILGYQLDYVTNLSEGGLFISSRAAPDLQATVHIQFVPVRHGSLVSTFARVTHVTPQGFGAQFMGLDAETELMIRQALTIEGIEEESASLTRAMLER